AAEMVREKLLRNLRDEVPHGTAVVVETMKEHTARSGEEVLDVDAIIYCERENHKGMIIGKGGATLKRIATQARGEMERFFQIQVNLKCWVKVKEDWRNREQIMRSFGYN
ncbi:MAG: KH domain-containing protein, partial [Oscillospiraceae bacterium]|nr:KH domain-containing protein [Oscillospiraceae bacterium]